MSGTAGEIGEFGLIARITAGVNAGGPVRVGVGDDAAVLRLGGDLNRDAIGGDCGALRGRREPPRRADIASEGRCKTAPLR